MSDDDDDRSSPSSDELEEVSLPGSGQTTLETQARSAAAGDLSHTDTRLELPVAKISTDVSHALERFPDLNDEEIARKILDQAKGIGSQGINYVLLPIGEYVAKIRRIHDLAAEKEATDPRNNGATSLSEPSTDDMAPETTATAQEPVTAPTEAADTDPPARSTGSTEPNPEATEQEVIPDPVQWRKMAIQSGWHKLVHTEVTIGKGERVTWGNANREQRAKRRALFERQIAGNQASLDRWNKMDAVVTASGYECLEDLLNAA
jgi:hypothetical protein